MNNDLEEEYKKKQFYWHDTVKYTDFHKNPNTSKKLSHFVHIIGFDMGTVMEEMIKISTKTVNVILPFLPLLVHLR